MKQFILSFLLSLFAVLAGFAVFIYLAFLIKYLSTGMWLLVGIVSLLGALYLNTSIDLLKAERKIKNLLKQD